MVEASKSLAAANPTVAAEWDFEKNFPKTPSDFVEGSHKKAWWLCREGHSWSTSLLGRKQGVNCPYCAGRAIIEGVNDAGTLFPHLKIEWNAERNGDKRLADFLPGSHKKVWWKCSLGHDWDAVISSRTLAKRGCPVCSGNKVLPGFNDLVATHPHLAAEWHPTKNGSLMPEQINAGSNKKVWWLCVEHHEWESTVNNRKNGAGCFRCSYSDSKRIMKFKTPTAGIDDFLTVHPHLAAEWHPTKNGDLKPETFKKTADERIWWVCDLGHEWDARIADRAYYQTGCPVCSLSIYVSRAEQEIVDYITGFGLDVVQSDRIVLNGAEVDIWIPEKKIGIEFNGVYWHNDERKTVNYHFNKWNIARKKGIQIIQIWEDDWKHRKHIVKALLAHKLGVSEDKKVPARKTSVVTVSLLQAEKFLNDNHIQGFASGSYYFGLEDNEGSLVAALVLKKEPNSQVLNIIRYATAHTVMGGFTKLLSYAEKNTDVTSFITFSDNMVSDGKLYEDNGFIADKKIAPDYMYVVKSKRQHKFGYRLKRFKNDPDLKWVEGYTERQLAELNGLKRVWDAGKIRWVKQVEHTDK